MSQSTYESRERRAKGYERMADAIKHNATILVGMEDKGVLSMMIGHANKFYRRANKLRNKTEPTNKQ